MLDEISTPLDLQDAVLGPVDVSVTADRIAFYVDATGDDPRRWTTEAPPGFGSVLLFAVADLFLYHERVVPFTATLLHLDQSFEYLGPMSAGSTLTVSGTITRVRERSGSYFVTFEAVARDGDTDVLRSVSTFVLSDQAAPPPEEVRPLPPVRERSTGEDVRSASRHDLVRYAAATRDFNPLHWDQDVAVAAGLPGPVVHGLLMYAWMVQAASVAAGGSRIASAKVRFRTALFPAEGAEVEVDGDGDTYKVQLARGSEALVTGTATVAAE